jgi:hypothetical protein
METRATEQTAENYWIFRAREEIYSLEENLLEGKEEAWRSAVERKGMSPGDVVYFWQGGQKERGLYGWGNIVAEPYFDEKVSSFRVPVQYEVRFRPYLKAEDLKKTARLADLPVFKVGPQQTFLRITAKQAGALNEVLAKLAPDYALPKVPSITGTNPPDSEEEVSTHITNDRWTVHDCLGYAEYARAFYHFLADPRTQPPLTISIQAPWGGGKTSLMRMIQRELDPRGYDQDLSKADSKAASQLQTPTREVLEEVKRLRAGEPSKLHIDADKSGVAVTVWFNAWKYQNTDQVWAGLAEAIIRDITDRLKPVERETFLLRLHCNRLNLNLIRRRIYDVVFQRVLWFSLKAVAAACICALIGILVVLRFGLIDILGGRLDWLIPGGLLATISTLVFQTISKLRAVGKEPAQITLSEYVEVPDYSGNLGFIHQVTEDLHHVFNLLPRRNGEAGEAPQMPLVVFVDDLDRCSPRKVAEVFEAINLFVAGEFPNCYFVLGMDTEIVAAALEQAHKDMIQHLPDYHQRVPIGWRFMDKFVQLPFVIPPLDDLAVREYADYLSDSETYEMRREQQQVALADPRAVEDMVAQQEGQATETMVDAVAAKFEVSPESAERLVKRAQRLRFIDKGAVALRSDSEAIRQLIMSARDVFSSNPRELKRVVNVHRFYYNLWLARRSRNLRVPTAEQLKTWVMFSLAWPEVVRWIHRSCGEWEQSYLPCCAQDRSLVRRQIALLEDLAVKKIGESGSENRLLNLDEWAQRLKSEFRLSANTPWLQDERLLRFLRAVAEKPAEGRLSAGAGGGFW